MSNPLIDHLEAMAKEEVTIARAKNHDYAGDADPLHSFRTLSLVLGTDRVGDLNPDASVTELLIFGRMLDKVARAGRLMFVTAAAEVQDESIRDTNSDGRNYWGIVDFARRQRQP